MVKFFCASFIGFGTSSWIHILESLLFLNLDFENQTLFRSENRWNLTRMGLEVVPPDLPIRNSGSMSTFVIPEWSKRVT